MIRLSGPTNSTLFTICCGVAICTDQEFCPECSKRIDGHNNAQLRWEMAKSNSPEAYYSLKC